MIIFLFGRPWAGKTRIGQELAQTLSTTFKDGDDWYSEEDRQRIARGEFTWDDSRKFFDRLTETLSVLGRNRMLVLSGQSLFLRKYREELKERFGNNIFLVYLDVPKEITLGRSVQGEREHFYGAGQYQQEVDEYEEDGVYDVRVENTGSPNEAVQKILSALAK